MKTWFIWLWKAYAKLKFRTLGTCAIKNKGLVSRLEPVYPQTRLSAVRVLPGIKLSPVTVATWIRSRVCWNLACLLHCSNDTFRDLKNLQKGHDFCLSDEWTFIEWLLFINWRKIALQCCVGFCPPTTWISHNYPYIPLLSLPPLPEWLLYSNHLHR